MAALRRFVVISTHRGKRAVPLLWVCDLLQGATPEPLPKGQGRLGGSLSLGHERFTVIGATAPRSRTRAGDYLLFRFPDGDGLVSVALAVREVECVVATDAYDGECLRLSGGEVALMDPTRWLKADEWAAVRLLSGHALKVA
jgi:hypothetical protein